MGPERGADGANTNSKSEKDQVSEATVTTSEV